MAMRLVPISYQIPGTLAASHVFNFTAPCDLQLIAASICNSSANAGTLKIGTAADDDAYLAAENFGVSGTPVIKQTFSDFDGATAAAQFPHIAAGTVISITITNHASNMANVNVVLFFTEG
jgi:hypothetical protein